MAEGDVGSVVASVGSSVGASVTSSVGSVVPSTGSVAGSVAASVVGLRSVDSGLRRLFSTPRTQNSSSKNAATAATGMINFNFCIIGF